MLERNHLVFVLEPVRQQLTSKTNLLGGKLVQYTKKKKRLPWS